ncbi:MAG: hypothetical protein QOG87_807 [Actinomycetota bacterium]
MICRRCSWIHVDGAGEFCNGCGARHGSGAPQAITRTMPRPSFGADLISASLLLVLFALLVVAAR